MNDRSLEELLERIEQLTAQLERASDGGVVDPVVVRVLLDEYLSALGQLRAGVRTAERRLLSVAATVDEGARLLRKERKTKKAT